MRHINKEKIFSAVKLLCIQANYYLPEDLLRSLEKAYRLETNPLGKIFIKKIIENSNIAARQNLPLCQDTGLPMFFIEIGSEVCLDFPLQETINSATEYAYSQAHFRESVTSEPLRISQPSFTPPILNVEIVEGDKLKITLLIIGGGSENSCSFKSFSPTDNISKISEFVIETVKEKAPYTCPPVIVGVGIGGSFCTSALLSKKALLRELGSSHPENFYADLEKNLLKAINNTNIGPQGIGGKITALALHIETAPTHISTLPVSISISCHSLRRKSIII